MAKKTPDPAVALMMGDAGPSDLTVRISRFLTNVLGTPSCHNFHAEAQALRDQVGHYPPEAPATEPTRFSGDRT